MPLHRRHTISSGASPKKKKTSSGPRVPFLPASDHKLTQLFEDLVWQVEQGVHRSTGLPTSAPLDEAVLRLREPTIEPIVSRLEEKHLENFEELLRDAYLPLLVDDRLDSFFLAMSTKISFFHVEGNSAAHV